jgi:uncharacterized pyridoxal phosphate-containing UPF0001 family protein
VRRQVEAACHRSKRDPSHVTLIGASKTVERREYSNTRKRV